MREVQVEGFFRLVDNPVEIKIKFPVLFGEEVKPVSFTLQTDPAGELIFIKKGNNYTWLHGIPSRKMFVCPFLAQIIRKSNGKVGV